MSRTRRLSVVAILAILSACSGTSPAPPPGTATPVPPSSSTQLASNSPSPVPTPTLPSRLMVVLMENRSYAEVIGSADAPYINSLAASGGLAIQYFAQSHPSLPNYVELISGSTHGISSDCSDCAFSGQTLADQLTAAGITWRAYLEGVTRPCPRGSVSTSGGYDQAHDAFSHSTSLTSNPAECSAVVPFAELWPDLASAQPPRLAWVIPGACNDGHDCPTAVSDVWAKANLSRVMSSSWYRQGGAILLLWDEGTTNAGCCNGAHGGQVAAIVLSSTRHGGARQTSPVDHAGTLRTIEAVFGLSYLGDAACTCSGDLLGLLS